MNHNGPYRSIKDTEAWDELVFCDRLQLQSAGGHRAAMQRAFCELRKMWYDFVRQGKKTLWQWWSQSARAGEPWDCDYSNCPSSFCVATFKRRTVCLITQKNMKQADSLSCLCCGNVSKALDSLYSSTSGAIRVFCVPLRRRQAMIASGCPTTACSQIGLH